jgi:hypothetical protein
LPTKKIGTKVTMSNVKVIGSEGLGAIPWFEHKSDITSLTVSFRDSAKILAAVDGMRKLNRNLISRIW